MHQPTYASEHPRSGDEGDRHRTARRLSLAGLVLALEIGAAVAIVMMVTERPATSAEAEPSALGTETVAAAPARYRSRTLEVQGTVGARPTRINVRDRGTFVLLGERRTRLLVVPKDGARVAQFRSGTPVVVRGTVVVPPKSARLARRASTLTSVARRVGAPAIVKVTEVNVLR